VSQAIAGNLIEPTSAAGIRRRSEGLGYAVASRLFAIALLAAAGLKADALWAAPMGTAVRWTSAGAWAEAASEWLVGAWLLAGVAPLWARRIALALLLAFIAASGLRLLRGDRDCGCFGRAMVHPGSTLAFDVGMVAMLLGCRGPIRGRRLPMGWPRILGLATITALSTSLCAVLAARAFGPGLGGSPSLFVFDAQASVGKPLSFLGQFDDASRAELSSGTHTLILYDHGCDVCREFLRRRLASPTDSNVSVVDISQGIPPTWDVPFRHLSLHPGVRCITAVPVEIVLANGRVKAVRQRLQLVTE
jgi:hypothetical protein